MHDSHHHVSFGQGLLGDGIEIGWMGTSMNNAIHIQIQVIKFRQESGIRNNLIDFGIPFRNPTIKLATTTTTQYTREEDCEEFSPNGREKGPSI